MFLIKLFKKARFLFKTFIIKIKRYYLKYSFLIIFYFKVIIIMYALLFKVLFFNYSLF